MKNVTFYLKTYLKNNNDCKIGLLILTNLTYI